MRVGIVMPTYNQAQWLPAAVQTAGDGDLLVVDDGSTDSTPEILRALNVPTVRQENAGTASAINRGVEALSGCDAYTWISSDNVMVPGWLDPLRAELDRGAGAAYGAYWWNNGSVCLRMFRTYAPEQLVSDRNCFFGPAFLIRASVWHEAGGHRGKISHDYDHWLRVEEVCWRRGLPIVGVDKPLCWYNAHDQRVTITRAQDYDADHWQAEARKRRS